MRWTSLVGTIYVKELVDILRDHRTLIAMIVVPIVLYPMLMLGSVQAVSYQKEAMREEEIIVGVLNDEQGQSLNRLIHADAAALKRESNDEQLSQHQSPERERWESRTMRDSSISRGAARDKMFAPGTLIDRDSAPQPINKIRILVLGSEERIDAAVRERSIHVGVILDRDELVDQPDIQNKIQFHSDKEDVRSSNAERRLRDVIQRTADRTDARRKSERGLPQTFDEPFAVETVDLSAPPSILGQVLPLILILMTITGAIYPAIDLTAGERERNTLESLMVCPVPVIHLIVGKFLVVTTVAIMGAALNLGSVTATVYFGGFNKIISTTGGSLPLGKMALILICLIPFAVLMSAIMIAVCSYARTFKEAQNYVTPVILAVLIPGGIAAMPATRLDGVMLVMPVGNMVLLARDLLLGAVVHGWQVVIVLLSTTLYAVAAVAIAANIFGRESVVFADVESFRGHFARTMFRPAPRPSLSMSVLYASLLFPLWFFIQAALSPAGGEDAKALLYATSKLMPILFVAIPAFIAWYWKVDLRGAFALRLPESKFVIAGLFLGLSAWIPAHEINLIQQHIIGVPESLERNAQLLVDTFQHMPLGMLVLVIAIIPAICEELLFRGFLLSGLFGNRRAWSAILASAAIFGVFHFFLFKFVVTAGLGVVLAYLCWRSRSIIPGMIAHCLHNTIGALSAVRPEWFTQLRLIPAQNPSSNAESAHLPAFTIAIGIIVFLSAIALSSLVAPLGRKQIAGGVSPRNA
ncbi:MAG: CPBP family intramembrane metalloprotease [Planctomycetes bacterium]|nr:CPBP family intramembrane metalloprotease [Planctomycetota bacterium]MBI3835279.1 CPBP family intramembrane metalloprotease [Planctomycetota bacterium]